MARAPLVLRQGLAAHVTQSCPGPPRTAAPTNDMLLYMEGLLNSSFSCTNAQDHWCSVAQPAILLGPGSRAGLPAERPSGGGGGAPDGASAPMPSAAAQRAEAPAPPAWAVVCMKSLLRYRSMSEPMSTHMELAHRERR